ncbi:MAG: hypothetical protein ACOYL9_14080, partial [Ilumatobacteraceae bacterium]
PQGDAASADTWMNFADYTFGSNFTPSTATVTAGSNKVLSGSASPVGSSLGNDGDLYLRFTRTNTGTPTGAVNAGNVNNSQSANSTTNVGLATTTFTWFQKTSGTWAPATGPAFPVTNGLAGNGDGTAVYPVDVNGADNATYPTRCGIDLGIGRLLTTGQYAGQYFAASGRINQVSVINTRNDDALSFNVNVQVSQFVNNQSPTDTFSSNLLGIYPEITFSSGSSGSEWVGQGVTPPTGVNGIANGDTPSLDLKFMHFSQLTNRQPLASSNTAGIATEKTLVAFPTASGNQTPTGMSVIDARLRLLIPVTANSGDYTATMTLSAL